VAKFHDATTKNREDAILFLVEGDSALNGILAGRDTKTMGAFPLRGKPMNVSEMEVSDLTKKKKNGDPSEFENILRITGLQLGVEVKSLSQIRFGRIVPATDQDLDGYSIRGLLMNMFYTFWPELFEMGVIYVLNTPIVKVKYKKEILRFYNLDDFEEWKVKHPNERYESQYLKGLGSSDDAEWISYLSQEELDKNLIQIKLETQEDRDMFKLIFSKGKDSADNRKEWLQIEEK
jgi:DNA gyrase/topoisomerase IV subunit B